MIHEAFSKDIVVSVIIPSADGTRGGNVPLLLQDLRAQTFQDMEVIVVVGIKPQGKAINQGVQQARGRILAVLDDDSRVPSPNVIANLVCVLDTHPEVGMVGASIVQPPDSNRLQRRVAWEFPRFSMTVVDEVTDSDMPCHGCCAFRRTVFEEIGGEPEQMVRGLDPLLRDQLRRKGYRVVLTPRTVVFHPVPGTWRNLARMFFRNGRGSAYAQRHAPTLIFDTEEYTIWQGRRLRTSAGRRALRFPLRTLKRMLTGHWIRAAGDLVYVLGYTYEMLWGPRKRQSSGGKTVL